MILEKHPLSNKYSSLFNKFNVNTPLRLAHFFGQAKHESGLKPIEENLRYSAKRLVEVFPKYFPTLAVANQYAMNPQKIGNRAYANRMQNGNEASGDGYKYRGRGFWQITGKSNYDALTKWAQKNGLNVDYVKNPDLLLNEADALIGALWFFEANNIAKYADRDDVLRVSKIINLGNAESKYTPNKLQERINETNNFKKVFACK